MDQVELRQEKTYCSLMGWALAIAMLCSLVWQGVLVLAAYIRLLPANPTLYYLLALVGYYIAALPLGFRLCRPVPAPPMDRRRLTPRLLGRWLVIGIALMWVGSLAGSWVNELVYRIAGLQPVDTVTETFTMLPAAVTVLGACVFGPVCEELLFRGLLARRLARYGQRPAALVSALLFALYHANLSQFFYAFALGLLLAYAYFYTGTIKTPILLHMLFNAYGSFVVLLLPESGLLPVLYVLSWPVCTIAGMILLARGWKRQVWEHGSGTPSIQTIFCNIGMTAAVVVCFVETALQFL